MSEATFEDGLKRFAQEMGRYWWALVLRGVLAILFGVMAFVWPGLTLTVLVLFVGAWMLVDGVFTAIQAFKSETRWQMLLYAAMGIVAGLITLFYPGISTLALLYLIAFWSVFKGVMEIILAIRLRKEIEREWLLILAGVLSVVFGVLLVLMPVTGALAVVWIIGMYAVAFGVLLVILGFRVRSFRQREPITV
jgi:uncharacterized membrane protein HdeD (DUF308 family)